MKQFFRDYFSFNQIEIKGIRVLLLVLTLLIGIYFLVPLFMSGEKKFDATPYQASVEKFMESATIDSSWGREETTYKKYNSYNRDDKTDKKKSNETEIKPFDPNGLPAEIWMQMGLTEKQAAVIKKYEAKGGKFNTKADVKKQFVISTEFYNKIEPYIIFTPTKDEVNLEHKTLNLDINNATKEELMTLHGVKDYLADGIIKYRNRLGGFISIEQLKEVKYLSERIYTDISPHCLVTNGSVKKLGINLADWRELASHPYIGGDLATEIVNYRKRMGIFKNADDFKKSGLVDDGLYAKLVPYLSFSH